MKRAALALLVGTAACPIVGSDVVYTCQSNSDCPPGLVCAGNHECLSPDGGGAHAASSSVTGATTGSRTGTSATTSAASTAGGGPSSTTASTTSAGTTVGATGTGRATSVASSSAGPTSAGTTGGQSTGQTTSGGTTGRLSTTTGGAAASSTNGSSTSGAPQLKLISQVQTGTVTLLREYNDEIWIGQNWADEDSTWTGAGGLYRWYGGSFSDETTGLLAAGSGDVAIVALTEDPNPSDGSPYYTYALASDGTLYDRAEPSGAWHSAGDGGLPAMQSICSLGGTVVLLGSGVLASYTPSTGTWSQIGTSFAGNFAQSGACWFVADTGPVGLYQVVMGATLAVSGPFPACVQASSYDPVDAPPGASFFSLATQMSAPVLSELLPLASPSTAGNVSALSGLPLEPRRGALASDLSNEYFAFLNEVSYAPFPAPAPTACAPQSTGVVATLPPGSYINGLGKIPMDSTLWIGANRGLFKWTNPSSTTSPTDAGFPGFAFLDAAQGGSTLFLLGNDQRIYVVDSGGMVTPFPFQPSWSNGVGQNHAIAAVGDGLVAGSVTYSNGIQEIEYETLGGSNPPVMDNAYSGIGPYRLAAFSPTASVGYVYTWQDVRGGSFSGAVAVDIVGISGGNVSSTGYRTTDAGGANLFGVDQVAVAGDAGVYFLAATGGQFSAGGFDFGPLSISGLPNEAIVSAAALSPQAGSVALVLADGLGYWSCASSGAPPASLSCAQSCGSVAGVTSVAYDAAGTLWWTATDGLHAGAGCTPQAASPEPLRLVAPLPGQSGPGAIYVTGIAHSYVYR